MRSEFSTGAIVGLCVGGLLVCSVPSISALAGEEMTVDGVLHVKNSEAAAGGVRTVKLEELWRAGGEDDEDVLFGVINKVLVDDDNTIYLLDQQLSEVKVYSADGGLVTTLGREGDGPGEFRRPADMCFMPDGTLGVVQTFPGKVIKLDLEGTPAGTWQPQRDETAGGFFAMVNLRYAAENLVASGIDITIDQTAGEVTRYSFLRGYTPDGEQRAEYVGQDQTLSFQNFTFRESELMDFIWRRVDLAPDGKVVVAIPRYGYQISVFARDGTLERVIERPYETWPRNDEVRTMWTSIIEAAAAAQSPPGTPTEIEDEEPDIEFLRVGDDGSIWVLTSRAMYEPPTGAFTVYDVFDSKGHFTEQVRIECPGSADEDALFFGRDDLVFMVTGFMSALMSGVGGPAAAEDEEAEPMEIICYRMQ